nr:zinc finger, CCHC-type [Tanacetum cinerariifolium]
AINSIIESRDAIFDKHSFSSVPRLSQRSLKDRTEDSGGLVVSERITEETADCYGIYSQSDYSSDGCKDNFLKWGTGKGGLYEPTSGFIIPGNENKVDLTKEFLSSRFSIKDMGEADVILDLSLSKYSTSFPDLSISDTELYYHF